MPGDGWRSVPMRVPQGELEVSGWLLVYAWVSMLLAGAAANHLEEIAREEPERATW